MAESLKLSVDDGLRFHTLEKVIDRGKKSFVEVGEALEEIRDKKLYRQNYGTFEEYCLKKWGWSANYGRRVIEAAEVAKSVPIGTIKNEGAARALAKVPKEQRAQVVEKAQSAGPVTAKAIREAARPIPATVELDREGFQIPAQAMHTWNRKDEPQKLLNLLSDVRVALTAAQQNKDSLYCEVNFSAVFADIGNAYAGIKRAIPHAVCLSCQGKLPEKCRDCGGRGMVSKLFYDQFTDVKLKEIRKKVSGK